MTTRRYRVLVAPVWLPQAPAIQFRYFELVVRLADQFDITLVGGARPGDTSQVELLKRRGVTVRGIEVNASALLRAARGQTERHAWSGKLATARAVLGSPKPGQFYWQDTSMPAGPRDLRRLVERGGFDAVHVDLCLAHWLRGVRAHTPIAVEFQDVISVRLTRDARLQNKARRRLLGLIASQKMRRYERSAAAHASVCVTTSSVDSAVLRSLARDAETWEVPNGVDTAYFHPSPEHVVTDDTILYTGSMDYWPNIDAMQYFAREVLPRLHALRPGLRLQIVGTSPPPAVQALAAVPGIDVVGAVPDVRPYLERAAVVVVPLRSGSGTRAKILQALAMGKAVVSTTVGAEGLNLDCAEIIRADAPAAFASAVGALLADPCRRSRLGAAGRRRVVAEYDWNASAATLSRLYERLAEGRSPGFPLSIRG